MCSHFSHFAFEHDALKWYKGMSFRQVFCALIYGKFLVVTAAKILIAVPFVFIVPGYVTFLILTRDHFGKKFFSLSETIFIQALISILVSSLFGLALAFIGLYSLLNLVIILAAYCAVLTAIFRLRFSLRVFRRPEFGRGTILMTIIIAVGAVLFFHPFEYIVGGWDPGAYVNSGVNTARTGSVIIHDDFLKNLSPEDQKVFSHIRNEQVQKYPGFPISDPEEGTITSGFYHLYPVWTAIFYSLFGLKFSLLVNAVFGLMAVIAVYFVGKTLFHNSVGIIAAFLLTINIAEVWQARFPTTEILAQYLIFSGIYTLAIFAKGEDVWSGTISALCLGAVFFARIDSVLLLPAIFIFFYYRSFRRWRKEDLLFAAPFSLLLLIALIYYLTLGRAPSRVVLSGFSSFNKNIMAVAAALILAGLAAARIFSAKTVRLLDAMLSSRALRLYIMAAIAAFALYAYFMRPNAANNEHAANLVELGWFLSPLGLALATAGIMWLTFSGLDEQIAPFYFITLTVSSFFIYNKMIDPSYMWAVRRYVPVVIPAAVIMMSYTLYRLSAQFRRAGIAVSCILVIALAAHSVIEGGHLFLHREYRGFIDFCEEFAERFDEDDVLVCDDYWLATPLYFIYGKNTLQVSDQHSSRAIPKCRRAAELMSKWVEEGKDVYHITHRKRIFTEQLDFVPVGEMQFKKVKLERSKKHLPRQIRSSSLTVRVFKAEKIEMADIGGDDEYVVDIGDSAFGLIGGFYSSDEYRSGAGERLLMSDMRWTGPNAKVIIPWFGNDKASKLTLKMSGGRPESIPAAEVTILVEGQIVGNMSLSKSFEEYELVIPSGRVKTSTPNRAVMEINSSTWNPKSHGISEDRRDLGIQIDWIKIGKHKEPVSGRE